MRSTARYIPYIFLLFVIVFYFGLIYHNWSISALPSFHILNGFVTAHATVKDSHWEIKKHVGKFFQVYYDPVVQYEVNGNGGANTSIFVCTSHGQKQSDQGSVEIYLQTLAKTGMTDVVFYKPPNYENCFDEATLRKSFYETVGYVILFILISLLLLYVELHKFDPLGRYRYNRCREMFR